MPIVLCQGMNTDDSFAGCVRTVSVQHCHDSQRPRDKPMASQRRRYGSRIDCGKLQEESFFIKAQ